MNCLDCQALVQQRLDGLPTLRTPEVEQHLAQCADCRELHAAARLLDEGVRALDRARPSDTLATRIVQAALADRDLRRRRVRLRLMMTAALAASILLLMLTGYLLPPTKDRKPDPDVVAQQRPGPQVAPEVAPEVAPKVAREPEPKAPALAERADHARQAVARLTERMADGTRAQAKTLLALTRPLELAPLPAWDEPLDPAAQSLKQATQTVAEGIEPMARTARGAWNCFVNELPMFDVKSN